MDDGCVKRQTPEGTLEKESEIKVIIYQDIAGMQISVSASLFRQRFLVCSSDYILCFEPAGCRRDKMMESGNKKNKKNLSESKWEIPDSMKQTSVQTWRNTLEHL